MNHQSHDNESFDMLLFAKTGQESLTFPYNEEAFKKFLMGLLGKPQTIQSVSETAFVFRQEHIKHIFDAIDDRIREQNNGHLVNFNARIVFSDNSSHLLNSLAELVSFNSPKQVLCTGLHLTLQYLIKFPEKPSLEKQEMNISFVVIDSKQEIKQIDELAESESSLLKVTFGLDKRPKSGVIQYTIKHTARTWGFDIDTLLTNVLGSIKTPENKIYLLFRKHLNKVKILILLLIMFSTISLLNHFISREEKNAQIQIDQMFSVPSDSFAATDQKLRFIAGTVKQRGALGPYVPVFLLFDFVFSFGSVWLLNFLVTENTKPSYILLSNESIRLKEKNEKKYTLKWILFFISLALSIICNVFSSFIYESIIH